MRPTILVDMNLSIEWIDFLTSAVLNALNRYEAELIQGAILVIDERKHRVRLLPL
jgi:hypothetical protein